ncbi:FadR/GntR family transcriptional regulator [Streptomyces violaceoruber]
MPHDETGARHDDTEVAIAAARAGAETVRARHGGRLTRFDKGGGDFATDADVARLEEHLQHMRDAGGDVTAFIDADIAFHLETARIARNTVLSDILHSIRALLQVWMERVSDIEGTVSGTLCEHDAVLQAIRARDPEAADRAMAEHMRMAGARLRASVDGEA